MRLDHWLPAVLIMCCGLAGAQESAPAWGDSQRGLRAGLSVADTPRMLGPLTSVPRLQRTIAEPWPAAMIHQATSYMLIAQNQRVWFTEKLPLQPRQDPANLTVDALLDYEPVDIGNRLAYPYQQGGAIAQGYPLLDEQATGRSVNEIVQLGTAILVWVVWLPGGSDGVLLRSNSLQVEIGPPLLSTLSEARRQEVTDGILNGFRQHAAAAQTAHAMATAIGSELADALTGLYASELPEHGRMWLANALIDIGGEKTIRLITDQLPSSRGGLAHVIAFHGPKAGDSSLDAAIAAAAMESDDPLLTAWALRGFSTFAGTIPASLLQHAMVHQEPRLRATAIDGIVLKPSDDARAQLLTLLKDDHPKVAGAAATALVKLNFDDEEIRRTMIQRLDLEDDEARERLTQALSDLTGRQLIHDAEASPEEQARLLDAWRNSLHK